MSVAIVVLIFGGSIGLFAWMDWRVRERIAEMHAANAADHEAWLRECNEARVRGEDPPALRPMRRSL